MLTDAGPRGEAAHAVRRALPYDDVRFAPRNFLRAAVLLLLKERPDHGYGLAERLAAMGVAEGNAGAMYRTLRRLEEVGLLDSAWIDSASGPPKRVYAVTPPGDDALAAWTRSLRATSDALNAYLDRYARHAGTPGGDESPARHAMSPSGHP